ncbi:MAG TPA: transporter [Gammaproteobacteria bacterium]
MKRAIAVGIAAAGWLTAGSASAQNRGLYPLGMSATGSGLVADPGLSYSNMFLFYARDMSVGPDGEVVATGQNSVLMDMNTIAWVSEKRVFGNAKFSMIATIPIANNSLSSDAGGAISGGGGLADSFYQPAIFGWHLERADIKAGYGFLAPTGSFEVGASDNVGSGYWTHVFLSGQTFFPTQSRRTAISAFQMYEIHDTQSGTGNRPGDTMNLDFSVMQTLPERGAARIQVGLIGYAARQMSAKTGPTVTAAESAARYRIQSLGVGSVVALPERGATLGFKYFDEFSNESTFEGHSLQISVAIELK